MAKIKVSYPVYGECTLFNAVSGGEGTSILS